MTDVMVWIVVVFLLVPGVSGAVMVVVGIRMVRSPTAVHRVPIDAQVVAYSTVARGKKVTFDYPAPDGSWLRATRYSVAPHMTAKQGAFVRAGDQVKVYVDPTNPRDVNLGTIGTANGFLGVLLITAGGLVVLVTASWAPRILPGA